MQEKAVAELDPILTKTGFTKAVEMIYEDMGTQMAKTLGVEKFGGNVQTSGVKKVGYSYWCTANKDMYRCKVENSLNYIDDAYFDAFSNASLLGKLQNLVSSDVHYAGQPSNNRQISLDLYRIGNFVYVHGIYYHKGTLSEYIFPDISVPDGFKPKTKAILRGFLWQGGTLSGVIFNINTDGTVSTTGTPSYDTNRFINMFTVYEI